MKTLALITAAVVAHHYTPLSTTTGLLIAVSVYNIGKLVYNNVIRSTQ